MATEPDANPSTTTLVDSNVLLDILTEDSSWEQWSSSALEQARDVGWLVINPVVFAEVAPNFDTLEDLDMALPVHAFRREALPYDGAFLASRAFLRYRRSGGTRHSPLPDFFIGAHAAVRGYRLLTRDPRRYRTYFPTVDIVAPT